MDLQSCLVTAPPPPPLLSQLRCPAEVIDLLWSLKLVALDQQISQEVFVFNGITLTSTSDRTRRMRPA